MAVCHSAVLDIAAADQSGHLLHLLRNGGTPSVAKAPRAAILLIGTNDLTWPAAQGAADPADFAAGLS